MPCSSHSFMMSSLAKATSLGQAFDDSAPAKALWSEMKPPSMRAALAGYSVGS